MRTNDLQVQGDIKLGGKLIFTKDDNEYVYIVRKKNLNWFQRKLHKLMGLEVVNKNGNN